MLGNIRGKRGPIIGLLDTLCTLARYYIHTCKCSETETSTEGVERFIKRSIKRERSIAKMNNELPTFLRKWDKFARGVS